MVEDTRAGQVVSLVPILYGALSLQAAEERFGDRFVLAIPLATRARLEVFVGDRSAGCRHCHGAILGPSESALDSQVCVARLPLTAQSERSRALKSTSWTSYRLCARRGFRAIRSYSQPCRVRI
jgi:hypothetical protein